MFFPDYGISTGSGHLNRLLSLAERVKDTFEIEFLFFNPVKYKFPFQFDKIINCETVSDEINYLSNKLLQNQTAIVLDGYRFNQKYQSELRDKLKETKIIYVDDFAGEQMFADIVINHAPEVKPEQYIVNTSAKLLLGLNYLMISPEFFKKRPKLKSSIIGKVFVCFGGLDKDNWSRKIVEILLKNPLISIVTIVLGENYQHSIKWTENEKIICYKNLPLKRLIKKMDEAEVIVVPASTMALEGLVLNKKILVLKTINNQEFIFRGLNFFLNVKTIDLLTELNIRESIELKIKELFKVVHSNRDKVHFKSLLKSKITDLLRNNF